MNQKKVTLKFKLKPPITNWDLLVHEIVWIRFDPPDEFTQT
jgi:hypothetical protein